MTESQCGLEDGSELGKNWELRVNPFHLSKALAHVTLVVDTDRPHDADGRTLIALGILEAVESCTRASEMVERLDGTYIHDDDWNAVEP